MKQRNTQMNINGSVIPVLASLEVTENKWDNENKWYFTL